MVTYVANISLKAIDYECFGSGFFFPDPDLDPDQPFFSESGSDPEKSGSGSVKKSSQNLG